MQDKSDLKAKFGRWCVNHIKNDTLFLKMKGYYRMGYWMNLKHPKTFQEKLNWLKLHDHKEIYHQMVDKFDAKKYIAERVGEQYVIPALGCWNNFDEIDFDSLPIALPEKYARSIGVTIGKHCFISTREWGHEPYLIEIGDNVRITRNVSVHTYGGALGTCSASRF